MIKIALVDDHAIMVDGLAVILQEEEGIEVIGAFTNVTELFTLLRQDQIDIVILDLNMPGMDGFDLLEYLKEKHTKVKSLVLTMLNDPPTLRRIIDLGANGYVDKNAAKGEVVKAIKEVHAWGSYLENASRQKLIEAYKTQNDRIDIQEKDVNLSEREKEVIRCILRKMKNKKMAATLFISENTVRSHKKNIFRKFNVGNTSELIIEIHKRGLSF